MNVIPFPGRNRRTHGTIHVMPSEGGGFDIGHESESGNSWGNFSGPYATGQEAIIRAHLLNAREYGGICHVAVCREAAAEADARGQQATPTKSLSDEWEF